MGKLEEQFVRAQQVIANLTTSVPLMLMTRERIKEFERQSAADPLIATLSNELEKQLRHIKRPEDFIAMSQAYEVYAEASTCMLLSQRGIQLKRTPGTGKHKQKRPDFMHDHSSGVVYFEVKALDIAEKISRHEEIAYDGLAVASDLAGRAKGPGVYFAEQSISGHKPDAGTAERIDETIKRIANTIKPEQINFGPSVLVVDLGRLPIPPLGASQLLPVFFHDGPPAEACVSGELWQIALGKAGEHIFELPDFDGKTNIGGHQSEEGILHRFPQLLAITFQFPGLSKPPELFTIWNMRADPTALGTPLGLSEHELGNVFSAYSDGLNDSRNELGWPYRIFPQRPAR
ncbi:MAG TPA: hypothetical protein VG387_00725 [Rhizomicrobium sp.]|jgi:hypothetical protein|nr:hypothetical protein [Rhizomicrobium sp.]